MANICDNRFHFSCKNNIEKWERFFYDLVAYGEVDDLVDLTDDTSYFTDDGFDYIYKDADSGTIEATFGSYWTFPIGMFARLFEKEQAEKDGVYFRCLSEEYGEGYVAMNIYKDGTWMDEQCFNLP